MHSRKLNTESIEKVKFFRSLRLAWEGVLLVMLACNVVWVAPLALAQSTPTFKELDTTDDRPSNLNTTPLMLARFPTTLSIAITADRTELRSVDIDGRVWRRPLGVADEAALMIETKNEPACAALSSDAKLLAFADPDGCVDVMDLDTKKVEFHDDTLPERTVTLAFQRSSHVLAGVTAAGDVRVWDIGTGKTLHKLKAERGPVQTAVFSADGSQLALASFSQTVTVHPLNQADKGAQPRNIQISASRVTALAFTRDGKQLVIAAADGTATVHDLAAEREPVVLGRRPFAIWSLALEPNGRRLAAGSWDGTIKIWDTKSWEELQLVKTHEESVASIVFDGEKGLISAGLDGRLLHWTAEVPGLRASAMIAGRADSVWVAAYSPDGDKLFVGGREKRFEIWDVESQKLMVTRAGHPTTRCASFSPDGKTLATGGDDGKIFLCSAATGETENTLLGHRGPVSVVLFTEDGGTLVSACDRGLVKLWDVATGSEKATWREHKQQIYGGQISPDGKWLITGGGNWTTGDPGELIVWELDSGRVRGKVEGHRLAVWSIVFTADGKHFASSDSSGAVKIWSTKTLEEVRTLQHSTWVRPLAMSPDGSTLAVGRGDGSVRLWDTATWTQKSSCDGHQGFTFWVQYAPRGKTLTTCGEDGTVRFWRVK